MHVLDAIDPAEPMDDLAPLSTLIGDARVVAVGEGAHFLTEYWTFRQRMLRYLHQRCGFGVFALEFGVREAISLTPWLIGDGAVDELRR